MTEENERDVFAKRQAEMTSNWYENLKKRSIDVDAYITGRQDAYIERWKEATRFIEDGSAVLDIGGGNLYPRLIEFLKAKEFRYNYVDVDPAAVDSSASFANAAGFRTSSFRVGFNDKLLEPSAYFDAVFSSHCIEHSFHLLSTFREINRVLKPGGNLLMSVPLGWEDNPEHPYFLIEADWVSLVADAGFDVRVSQIGKEYPEAGWDLFIAARKVSAPVESFRVDPEDRKKTNFNFVACDSSSIHFDEHALLRGDHVISHGEQWSISIEVPTGARELCPILTRHDWSGIVEVRNGQNAEYVDLYSHHSYVQPICLKLDQDAAPVITVRPVGRNGSSHGNQAGMFGYMWR